MVLGISFDPVKANRAFAKKYDFNFPLLSDPDRVIGLSYHAAIDPDQAQADRITYVISPEGTIQAAIGDVGVKTHATDILAILDAAASPKDGDETGE